MEIIGRWWNTHWGRIARRDIWLMREPDRWVVRGRQGNSEGREVRYEYVDEEAARAMVQRLMDTSPGDWRDMTEVMRLQRSRRSALDDAVHRDGDPAR